MRKFELVITKADGSPQWSEGFDTKLDLNQWLKAEQTRFYWQKDFKVEIIDNSKAVAEFETQLKDDFLKEESRKQGVVDSILVLSEKKNKTVADLSQMLGLILDHLGLAQKADGADVVEKK